MRVGQVHKFDDTALTPSQREGLAELRQNLCSRFELTGLFLYGSVARGEADDESDADLLVVTQEPLERVRRHEITDLVFDTNLKYGTNFSALVVDQASWETGPLSVLPLREEVLREGIPL